MIDYLRIKMNRSNANILFSLLSGVVLFLIIAYSAVSTIDSSHPDNYYVVTQGVDFHEGILNAPTQSTYAQYEQADMSISEYSPENSSYIGSNVESSNEARRLELANNTGSTVTTNQSTASNSGMTALTLYSESHKDAATQDAASTTTSSITTDGLLSGNATRQSAKMTGNGFGGVNEGDDPTGPPIPVGDGLLFLLFLIGIYTLWKSGAKIKQRLTTSYFNLFSLKNKNVRV